MTNGIAIAIIMFLMAVNIGILIKLLTFDIRKNKDKLLKYVVLTCLSLLGWQVVYLTFFISNDVSVMRFTFDFKLPFVALSSFFIFLLVVRFYRMEYLLNKTAVMIMLIVPAFTSMYALLSPNSDLIRETFSVVAIAPMHILDSTRGIWFWVHTAFCYTLMLGALIICIYGHKNLPKTYNAPSLVLLCGLAFVVSINVLQITGITYQEFDISFIGISIAIVAVYFSVGKSKGVDFIISARNEIYDYLSESIFILNDERYVVYTNRSAKEKGRELKLNIFNESYDNVFEKAVSVATNIEAAPADEDGLDMTFVEKGKEKVFNLRETPIKDNSGRPIGTFAVFDDVTNNREIINKLENIGGIDALTGLPNRRSIDKFMESLDDESKLPIALIVGDINGLKEVNDNLGHKQGDVLIRLVSEILTDVCFAKGRVSRIGGDEFLIVIPNSCEAEVKSFIAEAKKLMKEGEEYLFTPSVSFGYELKTESEQGLTNTLAKADAKMYNSKTAEKEMERRKG